MQWGKLWVYNVNMPTRNRVKTYGENTYYHIYNRGVDRKEIFREDVDYLYFLSLFKRHLSGELVTDKYGRAAKDMSGSVELVAFCLMGNHFHLLCYLKEKDGIIDLMRSVMTAYSMYFNKKYQRIGRLYQERFLAAPITTDAYLWHVSRYIHLNPSPLGLDFRSYPYSSIDYFAGKKHAAWLHPERLVETQKDQAKYMEFVADYESMHVEMDNLKHLLAAQ